MKVIIDKELENLIPGFLTNRFEDIKSIHKAVIARDFAQISMIGHNLKGIGSSYGFDDITVLGKSIEAASQRKDTRAIGLLTQKLSDFLENVEIIYH